MPDDIKVDPNPIQRNTFDVTIELIDRILREGYSIKAENSKEYMLKLFLEVYATVKISEHNYGGLKKYLPDNAKKLLENG